MARVAHQDQDALMALYQHYADLVYSLALRVLQHSGSAEEVTQDVFLKVWRQPDRWDPTLGRFRSWLLTLTRNAAIDRLRKEQRQPLWHFDSVRPDSAHSSPLQYLSTRSTVTGVPGDARWQDGQLLRILLHELPPEQQQVIELAFFYGFTHSELAHNLDLPLGTVKTRLRRGLRRLRLLWDEAHRAIPCSSNSSAGQ